ncbi:kinesin-like protein Klp61F [Lasioglossum baleicum]|uniref:kinesin-like protein Klp61F n=1 Tax=Lasioglossum baleicum TaxID=434251 RepID=UPI003FCD23C7
MNSIRVGKKEQLQNIQVFIRVRPINAAEQNGKSSTIVEVPNNREVVVHEFPRDKTTKKFIFDHVFGPSSKQIDVYNAVVSPLLEQVLAGYNCTVFAYGQTGTGKTFTMEGINADPTLHWQSDSTAGMIPRSLSHLFDELQLLEAQEFTIRVSFLELYNEDLFDLLSATDDNSKIKLYEDTSKKGAVIIHGLEEITVHNKSEVYKILEKGLERRQVAATLLNAQSSRSHTVFSVTVHLKENTLDGEEVLKTGKLNLVDLAGSENVGRSGAIDRRAREAGNVNQSLLTLGRVITALVERAPHIPYRESKLTRLLQESLGGRTKTSIIATVSPACINLEETLSTLDYARRAKNITNRPEINQKLSKKEFLKQYTIEIERLRRDLLATRERNGVYLANDNYNEMKTLISQQDKDIQEKINHIKALEKDMQNKEEIYNKLKLQNIVQLQELHKTQNILTNTAEALKSTHQKLKLTTQEREEQKYLLEKHVNTEQALLSQAQSLLNVADTVTADSQKLHEKIDRKKYAEQKFETLGEQFRNSVRACFEDIQSDICKYGENLKSFCTSVKNNIDAETIMKCDATDSSILIKKDSMINSLKETINESYSSYQNWTRDEMRSAANAIENEHDVFRTFSLNTAEKINRIIETKITENLQLVKQNLLDNIRGTVTQLNEMINSFCDEGKSACNSIHGNFEVIKKDVDEICKRQEFTEKQRSFVKIMENVTSEFNLLKQKANEHFSMVTSKCNYVCDICHQVNDHMTDTCNSNITLGNALQEHIQTHLEEIGNNVVVETEKNENIVNTTVIEGKNLVHELKSNVDATSNILKKYTNLVECNLEELCQNMDDDKNNAFVLVDNANKILDNSNENYASVMKDEETALITMCENISSKAKNLSTESTECCHRNIEELHAAMSDIDQFFDNEVQHDVPTGTTPARKQFSYPRQFTVTSPHERILQRFRETRRLVETSEDDDYSDLGGEMTLKQIANSTAISDITVTSSPLNATFFTPSMNSELLLKDFNSSKPTDPNELFTSALDMSGVHVQSHFSSKPKNLNDYLQNEDKENYNYNSLPYEKTKDPQPLNLKRMNN